MNCDLPPPVQGNPAKRAIKAVKPSPNMPLHTQNTKNTKNATIHTNATILYKDTTAFPNHNWKSIEDASALLEFFRLVTKIISIGLNLTKSVPIIGPLFINVLAHVLPIHFFYPDRSLNTSNTNKGNPVSDWTPSSSPSSPPSSSPSSSHSSPHSPSHPATDTAALLRLIEELCEENQALQGRVETLGLVTKVLKSTNKALTFKNECLSSEKEGLASKNEKLASEARVAKGARSDAIYAKECLQEEIHRLRQDLAKSTEAKRNAVLAQTNLKHRVNDLTLALADSKKAADATEKKYASLLKDHKFLKQYYGAMEAESEKAEEELRELRELVKNAPSGDSDVVKLNTEANNAWREVDNLTQQLESMEAKHREDLEKYRQLNHEFAVRRVQDQAQVMHQADRILGLKNACGCHLTCDQVTQASKEAIKYMRLTNPAASGLYLVHGFSPLGCFPPLPIPVADERWAGQNYEAAEEARNEESEGESSAQDKVDETGAISAPGSQGTEA